MPSSLSNKALSSLKECIVPILFSPSVLGIAIMPLVFCFFFGCLLNIVLRVVQMSFIFTISLSISPYHRPWCFFFIGLCECYVCSQVCAVVACPCSRQSNFSCYWSWPQFYLCLKFLNQGLNSHFAQL